MSAVDGTLFRGLFDWDLTVALLQHQSVLRAVAASAVLALLSALLGPFIVQRRMTFAVHSTSELAVTGAAAAILLGTAPHTGALAGALIAGLAFGLLGLRSADRDMAYGVVLSFGLGLSVLMLTLNGQAATNLSTLLTGGLSSVGADDLAGMAVLVAVVAALVLLCGRPLWFASVDPAAAAARGVPVRTLSVGFTVLVAAASAVGMQIVGALLVLSLMVAPAAASAYLSSSPRLRAVWTFFLAQVAAVGGLLLSLAPAWPPSTFITTMCFLLYAGARVVGFFRRGSSRSRG